METARRSRLSRFLTRALAIGATLTAIGCATVGLTSGCQNTDPIPVSLLSQGIFSWANAPTLSKYQAGGAAGLRRADGVARAGGAG